ncbi:MAG: hypothetical protein ACYTFY_01740 [Planctomycetota bacterium]|jgi:hypothetical protein
MGNMAKSALCSVKDCNNQVHAKGYCRKHYGQIWRKGKINQEKSDSSSSQSSRTNIEDTDRMRALEREYRKAKNMYRQVVGFEGRLKWRKEMEAVKKEIERLNELEEEMVASV